MSAFGTLFRALVGEHARRHALRALVTLFAVALGVASAYAIDLANATAISSFSSSVNVISNRVNLQVFGNGDGFDERALLAIERLPGVESANPVVDGELTVAARTASGGEILRVLGVDVTRATLRRASAPRRAAASICTVSSTTTGS